MWKAFQLTVVDGRESWAIPELAPVAYTKLRRNHFKRMAHRLPTSALQTLTSKKHF